MLNYTYQRPCAMTQLTGGPGSSPSRLSERLECTPVNDWRQLLSSMTCRNSIYLDPVSFENRCYFYLETLNQCRQWQDFFEL